MGAEPAWLRARTSDNNYMDHLTLLAAGDLVDTAKATLEQFGVDWPHFIAQCISFLIVAGGLYKWAYKPVLAVLLARRQRIEQSLKDADQTKKELANAKDTMGN